MRRAAVLAALVTALALAAPAGAATTVGQNFTPTLQVGTKATVFQLQVSAGTGYTVPFEGILTSWSFQTAAITEPTTFKVARPAGGSSFTIVGQGDAVAPSPDTLNSFPIRIPVRAGDVIGFYQERGDTPAGTRSESDSDQVAYAFGTDAQPGQTPSFFQISKIRMNVSARLELDADRDGFGDETQDLCPRDAETQEPCTSDLSVSATTDKNRLGIYEELTMTLVVKSDGRTPSNGTTLTYKVPGELEVISTASTTASCRKARTEVVCTLGDLPVGGSQLITMKARARKRGAPENAVFVASRVLDTDISNNRGAMPLTIVENPGACANTWLGNAENNSLLGGAAGDRFDGLAGHDLLAGLAGDDCLAGGEGDDRLVGGSGADQLDGAAGDDSASGAAGKDVVIGGSGDDRLTGGTEADRVDGGAGRDNLHAGSGNDRVVGGPDRDRIRAAGGNDNVDAADGVAEVVDCGNGRDRATVDRTDRTRGCERVRRVRGR